MVNEQRDVLDELVVKMRAGRMTRRAFFERARTIGLTTAVASSLLEACSAAGATDHSTTGTLNIIQWESQHDDHAGTYAKLVNDFNTDPQNAGKIQVVYRNSPFGTSNDQYTVTKKLLQKHDGSLDVLAMDVTWPAEFASSGWIVNIDDKIANVKARHAKGVIDSCMFNNHLCAVPLRTDVGLLYYNTNYVGNNPPTTWDELADMALHRKTVDGYVWQGRSYEGLVCNFVEVLAGYGGSILDERDHTKVTVNSPEAVAALEQMVSWIGTVSPGDITNYMEPDARVRWQNGFATFMRNWYDVYTLVKDPGMSSVYNTFNFTHIPYHGSIGSGHSCTGGWLLAINAFSPRPRQEAAWQFIKYMLDNPVKTSFDQTDIEADPRLQPIFEQAVSRPRTPNYGDLSLSMRQHLFAALQKQVAPSQALKNLEDDLKKIVSRR